LKMKLVGALAPTLLDITTKTLDWYKANKQLVDDKVKAFVQGLSDAIGVLVTNINIVVEVMRIMANLAGAILVGYIASLTIKIVLWTAALITNVSYHIKATIAMRAFSAEAVAASGAAAALTARCSLLAVAAKGMWAAIGGPVGLAVTIAFILLEFIGIEKIVSALKTAFDYILGVCKSIGTAISNWFAGGDTLDKQIESAEKRVETERKNLESMKRRGGGVDDLRVAASRLAKEEAILSTLRAQKVTATTVGAGPSESKYAGVIPTSPNYVDGVTPDLAAMTEALGKLSLARERALADTLEKEKALALRELDIQMAAELAKYKWSKDERLLIESEYEKIRAATAETYDIKIRQKRMEILASTGKEMMEANAEFYDIYLGGHNEKAMAGIAKSKSIIDTWEENFLTPLEAAKNKAKREYDEMSIDLEAGTDDWKKLTENYKKSIENLEKAHSPLYQAFLKIGQSIEDNITDNLTDAMLGAQSLMEAFANMARSIASDLIKIGMKMIWLNAIGDEKSGGGWGSLLAKIFGSAASSSGGGTTATYDWYAANGGIAQGGFKSFAGGGTVTKPTLGLVGEGRYNEAIVPLPDGKSIPVQMKGGGGINTTINVSVNNTSGSTKEDNQKLGNQVSEVINYKFKEMLSKEMRVGGMLNRSAY
jgi:hypothetical protein